MVFGRGCGSLSGWVNWDSAGVSSQRCEIMLRASVPSPEPNMSYLALHNNLYGEISLFPFLFVREQVQNEAVQGVFYTFSPYFLPRASEVASSPK